MISPVAGVTVSAAVGVILYALSVGVTLTPSLVELVVDVLITEVGLVGSIMLPQSVTDKLKRAKVNSSSLWTK